MILNVNIYNNGLNERNTIVRYTDVPVSTSTTSHHPAPILPKGCIAELRACLRNHQNSSLSTKKGSGAGTLAVTPKLPLQIK